MGVTASELIPQMPNLANSIEVAGFRPRGLSAISRPGQTMPDWPENVSPMLRPDRVVHRRYEA